MASVMDRLEPPREAKHVVVICGGAVAGSEAAARCAERGALAIVLEQNERPYGKIEDGLPRWHVRLRKKEYERIDANLNRPGVIFVPRTALGRDVSYSDLVDELGPSAVILAVGAWRDRPLPVPGIDAYVDRGLVYQNAFVYWFNHYPEEGYTGPRYEVPDRTIVIGGGLASIDVVKIIQFELYGRALRERGIETDVAELETKGIPAVVERHGLRIEDLGIEGCTLFYRRRKRNMPLATADNPTPEQVARLETARLKVMDKVERKYLVRFRECQVPVAPIVEKERLAGIVFRRTELRDGRLAEIGGSDWEARSTLVVSSIGSVPVPIEGVPMRGELYDYRDPGRGELGEGVYGLGNVLTGRGNIKESRASARDVTEQFLAGFLGVGRDDPMEALAKGGHAEMAERMAPAVERALRCPPLEPARVARIFDRVRARWEVAGYDGDYRAWIERVTPPDLA